MRAHAHDLRAEVAADLGLTDGEQADAYVAAVARDWRSAPLDPPTRALCEYAEKLTCRPAEMGPADVGALRSAGFDDRGVHDATQVISYFNYINRIADALGVPQEDFVRAWEKGGGG